MDYIWSWFSAAIFSTIDHPTAVNAQLPKFDWYRIFHLILTHRYHETTVTGNNVCFSAGDGFSLQICGCPPLPQEQTNSVYRQCSSSIKNPSLRRVMGPISTVDTNGVFQHRAKAKSKLSTGSVR